MRETENLSLHTANHLFTPIHIQKSRTVIMINMKDKMTTNEKECKVNSSKP